MKTKERRKAILATLQKAETPITGKQLSAKFNVTRQVIVADIAILRAKNENIIATPQGYIYTKASANKECTQIIAAKHSSEPNHIKEELYTIVDSGTTIKDVIVEHPLYGEITAMLQINSRYDVDLFIKKLVNTKAEPLLVLTDGLHLHTLEASSPENLKQAINNLKQKDFLAE